MKMNLFSLLVLFFSASNLSAQIKYTLFSELTGQKCLSHTNVTKIPTGFLIQGVYTDTLGGWYPLIYKLSSSGKILESKVASYNNSLCNFKK